MKVEIKYQRDHFIEAKDMKIGQVAVIVDAKTTHAGEKLLRTFDGFVSLDNPKATWSRDCPLRVELLDVGTQITLTVED